MNGHTSPPALILGSGSRYRRELLARLGLPFECQSPDVDETPLAGETALETACRLALLKAQTISKRNPNAVVIGSDQVVLVNGHAVSKPGNHENAVRQLQTMRGQTLVFHSAVAIVSPLSTQTFEVPTRVRFRDLTDAEIERYLRIEQPYDCAGSAKSEGLGITLLEKIESTDPTALIGLPLIELSKALRAIGYPI